MYSKVRSLRQNECMVRLGAADVMEGYVRFTIRKVSQGEVLDKLRGWWKAERGRVGK